MRRQWCLSYCDQGKGKRFAACTGLWDIMFAVCIGEVLLVYRFFATLFWSFWILTTVSGVANYVYDFIAAWVMGWREQTGELLEDERR